MKSIFKIITLVLVASSSVAQDKGKLFPISEGELWGYIDQTGKTVIIPQFRSAGHFSEGLAEVRVKGTYGYIDQLGNIVIAPKFDLALPFQSGIAKVFIDAKPYFINREGNIIFQHNFKNVTSFHNNSFAIATNYSNEHCLIDKTGKQITENTFQRIEGFNDGVAVVYGKNHVPYPIKSTKEKRKYEVGVIDTTGKWVVKYGKYQDIGNFKNGFADAKIMDQSEDESSSFEADAVIDKNGQLKFIRPFEKYAFDNNNRGFYNDLAVVSIYYEQDDSSKLNYSRFAEYYKGVISTNGEILFSDTNWVYITPFTYNRAFVQDKSKVWKMINTAGKQVGDSTFENILYQSYFGNPSTLFTDGFAWVKFKNGWTKVDTTGKILSEPKTFSGINDRQLSRIGDIIFMEQDISVENEYFPFSLGFWNTKTDATLIPTYNYIDKNSFGDPLIYAMKDGLWYYINSDGNVIWKETESETTLSNLNIDFMNRAYFYAHSTPNNSDIGGFGGSDNAPKQISDNKQFQSKHLSVEVHPELKDTIFESYNGLTVYVANNKRRNINFNAQDSRLYMHVQALNSKGKWEDIEYLPSSWCGNSYHTLTLESKHYWQFLTPNYDGEFETKLRIVLKFKAPTNLLTNRKGKKEITIYSNEYDGSINPGQFWNKRTYYPGGLMDPYND